MNDDNKMLDNKPLQLAWALYRHGYWAKQDLLEWIYQQLAREPDNPFWANLIFYDPSVYFCLYTELFPPLQPLSFKEAFALHLAKVDIANSDSIHEFNSWLFCNYYSAGYVDERTNPDDPEFYYFYYLEHYLEYLPEEYTKLWMMQQLQVLIPEAQKQAQQLLSIL